MSLGSLGLWVRLPPFLPDIAGRAGASLGFISQVFEFNSRPRIQNSHDRIRGNIVNGFISASGFILQGNWDRVIGNDSTGAKRIASFLDLVV